MTGDKLYLLPEAAELTGATVETIRQRIKRRKLYAVKGNDGRVRVRLTDADIAALKTGQSTSQPTKDSSAIKALEAHVQTLREQLEQQRTDHQTERQALRDENNRLRDGLSIERDHARDLAGRLDTPGTWRRGGAAPADQAVSSAQHRNAPCFSGARTWSRGHCRDCVPGAGSRRPE
jgi:FtsZ-binding cell division protein ZapB